MAITYEDINPPIIENTIMRRRLLDGVARTIQITPIEGYVLHDNNLNDYAIDEETQMPTEEIVPGYKEGEVSVRYDYDFDANPRELYAVPRNTVPSDRIFGGVNNPEHEIM